jgi:hypothetical protein
MVIRDKEEVRGEVEGMAVHEDEKVLMDKVRERGRVGMVWE